VGFSYDTSLFDRSTIERFIAHYIRVLRQVVASPDMALAEIDLLTRSERHALASRPRPSSAPRSAETVLDRFDRQARLRPDAVAIEAAGHFLTYRDLQARASALARQLRGRGVGRGQLVGICVPRGAGLAAAMLGVLKSGAAYVPLDPSYPADRLNVMLRDSGVTVVITEPALAGLLPPWAALMFANAGDSSESVGASLGVPEVDDDQLAYVIYTSGSTGVPKGVG
jgi:aspartate racemase